MTADCCVLGVDACTAGWVGLRLDDTATGHFGTTIGEVVAAAGRGLDVVAIDIPIGLPDTTLRRADLEARQRIGARRSAVFMTPIRAALMADSHAEAVRLSTGAIGVGVSIQAYGLRHRILEVEEWLSATPLRVVEAHPEVCFAEMANAPNLDRKATWNGIEQRRRLLGSEGIALDSDVGDAGRRAAPSDVLDAAAVAWTARRVARGLAYSVPGTPEVFSDGWPCAIWV